MNSTTDAARGLRYFIINRYEVEDARRVVKDAEVIYVQAVGLA